MPKGIVFIVRYSEDGVHDQVFTNVKALFDEIADSGYKTTNFWSGKPYNYKNLIAETKVPNKRGFFISCENDVEIEIINGQIISKK